MIHLYAYAGWTIKQIYFLWKINNNLYVKNSFYIKISLTKKLIIRI